LVLNKKLWGAGMPLHPAVEKRNVRSKCERKSNIYATGPKYMSHVDGLK
jgi:hypothetical protein